MLRAASVFCFHLIGQSSLYIIVSYAIKCLLSLCIITEELGIVLLPQYLFDTVKGKKRVRKIEFSKTSLHSVQL